MASTLNLFRNGAVGFIDWLDGLSHEYPNDISDDDQTEEDGIDDPKYAEGIRHPRELRIVPVRVISTENKANDCERVRDAVVHDECWAPKRFPGVRMPCPKSAKNGMCESEPCHKDQGED